MVIVEKKDLSLDIGCGVAPRGDVNIDIRRREISHKIPNFLYADAVHLPFRGNTFRKVFLIEVLEHCEDPLKVLREIYRVCYGTLCLTTPNAFILDKSPDHIYSWNEFTLKHLLSIIPFNKIEVGYTRQVAHRSKRLRFSSIFGILVAKFLRLHRQLYAVCHCSKEKKTVTRRKWLEKVNSVYIALRHKSEVKSFG